MNLRLMAHKIIALTTELHEQVIDPNSNSLNRVKKNHFFFKFNKIFPFDENIVDKDLGLP